MTSSAGPQRRSVERPRRRHRGRGGGDRRRRGGRGRGGRTAGRGGAGFAFYEASNIFEPLHARARDAGVEVELFIHVDGTGQNTRMSPSHFFTYSWPWRDVTPRLNYDVHADAADASSTMHAKCVIVDDREVLITSANFTGRAQHTNIELGVLIRDAEFASRVSGQWHSLVTQGLFRGHGREVEGAP